MGFSVALLALTSNTGRHWMLMGINKTGYFGSAISELVQAQGVLPEFH